ncbi:MAG: hypothetical protein ACHQF0_00350 [Chitinophagales bacterium]
MRKIVHLQFSTESAGKAAFRLQNAFLERGIDSHIISFRPDKTINERITYLGGRSKLIARLDNKLQPFINKNKIKEFGLFSYPILGSDVSKMAEVKAADFIYIHWVLNGFLNLRSIKQLARLNKPIIFFMHDMWPITGGCHHSFSCEKYKTRCNECQVFQDKQKNDLAAKGFEKKMKLYSQYHNFYFISPSKWLFHCAKQASLTRDKPVFYIPNVLNTNFFKPLDKTTSRQELGMDIHQSVIAFGATSVDNPYKGWPYLQKALLKLSCDQNLKNISVLIFGSGYNKELENSIPFKTTFLGYLKDEHLVQLAYNAAEYLLCHQ